MGVLGAIAFAILYAVFFIGSAPLTGWSIVGVLVTLAVGYFFGAVVIRP
ncbi:hypothetical protein [Bradyrhizobium sp. NAS80.1]|nr:hypothetical protein [Bradyrhizobium sp. NAS80.1]